MRSSYIHLVPLCTFLIFMTGNISAQGINKIATQTIQTDANDKNYLPVYDPDGNKYTVIKIGNQYWFQQNLRTTKYSDATAITTGLNEIEWKQTTKGAFASYENLPKNADIYGLLYNGYAVSTGKLCPKGWHIPTDAEWKELETFLGIDKSEINRTGGRSTLAGLVKSPDKWKDNEMKMENTTGFSVLPSGTRNDYGDFMVAGQFAGFWTSTPYETTDNYLWYRHFYYNTPEFGRNYVIKNNGYSCRCLKDSVIVEKKILTTVTNAITDKIDWFSKTEIINKTNNVTDFSKIKICVDVAPKATTPLPYRYPANAYTYYKINPDGTIGNVAYQQQPLSAYSELMWMPGEVVKYGVIDLNGRESSVIDTVKKYVRIWENHANLKLEYTQKISEAQIRISFESGKSYSYIGRHAINIESNKNTMNLGWIGRNADENRRVILHEFGHALGFIHEHNSALSNIPWDKEKVYAYYAGAPNYWTREMVDHNVFYKFSKTETNFSEYDRNSIMHYQVDPAFTTDGSSVPFNSDLSATDKQYAGIFYPHPIKLPTATGTLKTGDDCDEIDFKIEFDAIERDRVEFILQPGINRTGKVIEFWKQIAIPLIGYSPLLIQMEGGKPTTSSLRREHIDDSKGIGFFKAKMFGVHTELAYKWNILKAIRGGCRITLSWRNDSCP